MTVLVVLVAVLLAPAAWDLTRSPELRRLAIRNAARRPSEAALVVGGALLGTAIIVASFVIGDTIDATLTDSVRTTLGPIDHAVITDVGDTGAVLSALDADTLDTIDGIVVVAAAPVVATSTGDDPQGDPRAWVAEAGFDDLRGFGPHADITGFAEAGPTPEPGQVVVNERVAADLGVDVGDEIVIHGYGAERALIVRDVIPRVGVAGWNELWVAPGTIESMVEMAPPGAEPPSSEILISVAGGLYDSLDASPAVLDQITERVEPLGTATVLAVKADRVDDAEAAGAEFTTLFSGIGGFSVLAGILLLVNLFVMLTEERKSELGMLRAIGLRRGALSRVTTLEGAFYAVTASVVGAGIGIGVGAVMVSALDGIFGLEEDGLSLRFTASPSGVATGALIGLSIAMVTIWVTSGRVARINIIEAIRDLPRSRNLRRRWIAGVGAAIGVLGGAGLTVIGIDGVEPMFLLLGPAIAGFSLVALAGRFGAGRLWTLIVGSGVLVWSVIYTRFFDTIGDDLEISVFVVQGAVLVAAATVIAVSADRAWMKAVGLVGRGVGGRLALAYPLARRVRSGLLLAMYSLVMFTMAFLTVFSSTFSSQSDAFAESSGAGFEIVMESNVRTPVDPDRLLAIDGVDDVAPLTRRGIEFVVPNRDEPRRWAITGFDDGFLAHGGPKLSARAPGYDSDLEVLEAVASDPTLVVVNPYLLSDDNATGAIGSDGLGETIVASDPETGSEIELTVVGLLDGEFVFHGALVAEDSMAELFGTDLATGRYFVSTEPGVDADEVAGSINATFLTNGADAQTFTALVAEELGETVSFLRLLQGFLGLGLVIGIAGLGVVLVRAVRERRREIGMLRATGVPAGLVRRAFVTEASFIAVQGLAIGIGLGLVTGYQVIVESAAFGGSDLSFDVSLVGLAVIMFVPLVASLLAAVGPATRASRIVPAEALRIAG